MQLNQRLIASHDPNSRPQYSQVDLMNKESIGPTPEEKVEQYMRSYVIAWPADRLSNKPSRVPFSDLVIGLLAHSLLIQTINDLFVGDKHPTTKSTNGFSELLAVLTPQVLVERTTCQIL